MNRRTKLKTYALALCLLHTRRRQLKTLTFSRFAQLCPPIAYDGFTQLVGWRESTWQLRTGTGLLFGIASGWLVLPRLDAAFGPRDRRAPYAPENACPSLPQASTVGPVPPRG